MISKEKIMKELEKVIDPEIGIPITEMKLIDNINIEGSEIEVEYHLTMPFCPPVFALAIGQDIRKKLLNIEEVTKVIAVLSNHQMADEINKKVNK